MNIEEKSEVSIKRYAFMIPILICFIKKLSFRNEEMFLVDSFVNLGLTRGIISCIDIFIANLVFWTTAILDRRINTSCSDLKKYYHGTIKGYNGFSIIVSSLSVIWFGACASCAVLFPERGNDEVGLILGIYGLCFGFSLVISARIWVYYLEKMLDVINIEDAEKAEQRRIEEEKLNGERLAREEQEAEFQRMQEERRLQREEKKRQNEERMKELRTNLEKIQEGKK